jgi:carboxymethylenebutenolidase
MMQSMPKESDRVTLDVSDGTKMNAYVARPSTPGPHAGILVFQDGFGVNAPNRAIADQYATHGFVAIAPELFHRTAEGFEADYDDIDSVMPHILALTTEGLVADSTAAFEWLAAQQNVLPTRIAAVGFCMGGRTAFLANSALPLAAAISYYGGSIAPSLLDRAPLLHGPHLFFWGGQDKGIPPEQRRAVADAVRAAGKRFIDVEFSNADHGFVTAHRYEPAAAQESWALALAFLDNALGLEKHQIQSI